MDVEPVGRAMGGWIEHPVAALNRRFVDAGAGQIEGDALTGGAGLGLVLGRLTGLTGYQPLEDIGRQLSADDAAERAEATVEYVLKKIGADPALLKDAFESVKQQVAQQVDQADKAAAQQQPSA